MSSMTSTWIPSKPIISSLTSAESQFRQWLKQNHYKTLNDKTGLQWLLKLDVQEGPSPDDWQRPYWVIRIRLETRVDPRMLVRSGTLDPILDERLIDHLEGENVWIKLRDREIKGERIDKLRMELAEIIQKLREFLEHDPLHDMKRKMCGTWLDQRSWFPLKYTSNQRTF